MAIALVQDDYLAYGSMDPAELAYTSNNTAGNLLTAVVKMNTYTVTVSGITDSQSNTWQRAVANVSGGAGESVELWYAMNCKSGANTVTADLSATDSAAMHIQEWSGAATASALDQTASADNDSNVTEQNCGSLTPSVSGCLSLCAWSLNVLSNSTVSGYATVDSASGTRSVVAYLVVSNTATQTPIATTGSGRSVGVLALFKPVAAAGTPLPVFINLQRQYRN